VKWFRHNDRSDARIEVARSLAIPLEYPIPRLLIERYQCRTSKQSAADRDADFGRKGTMKTSSSPHRRFALNGWELPRRSWTIAHSEVLERLVDAAALQFANARSVAINMAGVQELDTLGACCSSG